MVIYSSKKVEQFNDYIHSTYKSNEIKLAWMKLGWMIAKCVRDETTKLCQYRRYQSWDSLGNYRLRRKGRVKEMGFNLLRKREVERSDTGEFEIGEGMTWWTTWRRWDGKLFHKTGAEWQKDLFAILRREMREGRLRVIREEQQVQRCEGTKEESGGKKVDQFWEICMWERELCIWFSHLSWASGEI